MHKIRIGILSGLLVLAGCAAPAYSAETESFVQRIDEDWTGDDKQNVALYLDTYEHLPSNYMTKKEARKEGWDGGALHLVIPGKCIGGDVFGNYEGSLPENENIYRECDIGTLNSTKRGTERIIYSDDAEDIDIWYTGDHYESFELLYGDGE